jgi:ribosomal protein L28
MAKKCPICGKDSAMVGKRNLLRGKYNPTKKTRKYPNLQWAALPACADRPAGGRVKICTSCLKAGLHLKKTK